MNTDISVSAQPNTQRRSVAGVRGWLLFFLIVLIWRIYVFIRVDGNQVRLFFEWGLNWPLWVITSRSVLYAFEILLPLWIIYVLLTKRMYAVKWAKSLILLAPLTAFISLFHDSSLSLFDFKFRFLLTLLSFSVPWFLYFTKSKRVRNTYMFTEKLLPSTVDCPFCAAELELSTDERASRNVLCPECQRLIQEKG